MSILREIFWGNVAFDPFTAAANKGGYAGNATDKITDDAAGMADPDPHTMRDNAIKAQLKKAFLMVHDAPHDAARLLHAVCDQANNAPGGGHGIDPEKLFALRGLAQKLETGKLAKNGLTPVLSVVFSVADAGLPPAANNAECNNTLAPSPSNVLEEHPVPEALAA